MRIQKVEKQFGTGNLKSTNYQRLLVYWREARIIMGMLRAFSVVVFVVLFAIFTVFVASLSVE